MVFAVKQQVFKQFLEKLHREDLMVQICILANGLLEVAEERVTVWNILLSREFKDVLELNDEAVKVKAIQISVQRSIA